MTAKPAELLTVAEFLDRDDIYDIVADCIVISRDKAPRHPDDRDSGDVLDDVIAGLREHANSAVSH